ncbi:MAG TPA: CAP domain-containing protein [Gaiellaceae bacterium]|nr:CAP domain-containing protein [Gaiellaceae bacterium]
MGIARRIGPALLLAAVAAAVVTAAGRAAPAAPARSLSTLESGVLADINAFRAQHGLAQLRLNARLTAAARQHSKQMAVDGYFAHNSVNGLAFWKRIQDFYSSGPWSYWSVGENLLWSSPSVDPAHALKLWIASPEHLANLLNPHWREIGVAAVHDSRAPGVYHGLPVTIVTTDFGVRH